MKLAFVLAALAACSSQPKPKTTPAEPVASMVDCPAVADHVAKTVQADKPRPGVTFEAIHDLVASHCKADQWSDDAKQCLVVIATIAEGRACASKMTDAQRTAIRAAARELRKDDAGPVEPNDHGADWIEHVVE